MPWDWRVQCQSHTMIAMKLQQEPSAQEVLAGLVERVTFHNNDNGFCVLRIKARGHRELITVVGHAARPFLPVSGLPHPANGSMTIPMASSSSRASCAPPLQRLSTVSRNTWALA